MQVSPILGRESERSLIRDAVSRGRLTTVLGPPGVGKTRLVREVIDGVMCSLSGVDDEAGVCWALSRALGLSSDGDLGPTVARGLSGCARPVVLDGADGARAPLIALLPGWLAEEGPAIVVTARSPLGLEPQEQTVTVPPLPLVAAAALWSETLGRIGHTSDPSLAAEIVARLDRLPLAIEWFASRAAYLGEAAALQQLTDFAVGGDPLAGALDQTLSSLNEEAASLLLFLSAFESGAPSTVFSSEEHGVIERLADAALVHADPVAHGAPRIRAYRTVIQRMRASARSTWADVERQHAERVLAFVARHDRALSERCELDRVASRFATRDPATALRAILAMAPLALRDGSTTAMRDRLAQTSSNVDDPPVEAALWLGRLERRLGRLEQARGYLEDARAMASDHTVAFEATIGLAHVERQRSHSDAALARYREGLALARSAADVRLEASGLGELGRMLQSRGRFREAQRHHEQAIALCVSEGLTEREGLERSLHARAVHREGRVREAIALHHEALSRHEQLGQSRLAAAERGHLAYCRHELGDHAAADTLFRASIEGLLRAGDVVMETIERLLLARLLGDVSRLSEARLQIAIAARSIGNLDMPRLAVTRGFIAGLVELEAGDLEAAHGEWTAAAELARDHGYLAEVGFEALLPAYLLLARHRLGAGDSSVEDNAELVASMESMGPRLAWEVLTAARGAGAMPDVDDAVRASSSDVRRAIRHADMRSVARVAVDGRSVHWHDRDIQLGRRSAPRRLLVALVEARIDHPGMALGHETLIEAGGPGERMLVEAARKRLRTAIWTLRKLGLDALIMTRDDGYLLDPQLDIEWSR